GSRVGVPWLGWTDGECRFCQSGRENLCDNARFTGFHVDGGYAEAAVADARFCFRIPEGYTPVHAAPLLCAGLIGYRALRLAGDVVCAGIHMTDIPTLPYELLWEERVLRSVANLTREDAKEFLELAPRVPVETHVERFPLAEANEALVRLRTGKITGSAVLEVAG